MTRYIWWSIVRIGVARWQGRLLTWCWWWWYLLSSWQQVKNHLSGYFFPSLIRNFTKLNYDFFKGVHDGCLIEVNEVGEHWFFGGRRLYTVHWVLAFLKRFVWMLLKLQLSGGCLFSVSFFSLRFLSYSQPPVCIVILYQRWGRFPNLIQGSTWRFHDLPISPSFYVL